LTARGDRMSAEGGLLPERRRGVAEPEARFGLRTMGVHQSAGLVDAKSTWSLKMGFIFFVSFA
jgi:hypothetical protein